MCARRRLPFATYPSRNLDLPRKSGGFPNRQEGPDDVAEAVYECIRGRSGSLDADQQAAPGDRAVVPSDEVARTAAGGQRGGHGGAAGEARAAAAKAARIEIQLTQGRDGAEAMPTTNVFTALEIDTLAALNTTLEGSTERQQNHHPKLSLARVAWIIARLGGRNCYYKPPGPIIFRRGMEQFHAVHRGRLLEMRLERDVRFPQHKSEASPNPACSVAQYAPSCGVWLRRPSGEGGGRAPAFLLAIELDFEYPSLLEKKPTKNQRIASAAPESRNAGGNSSTATLSAIFRPPAPTQLCHADVGRLPQLKKGLNAWEFRRTGVDHWPSLAMVWSWPLIFYANMGTWLMPLRCSAHWTREPHGIPRARLNGFGLSTG